MMMMMMMMMNIIIIIIIIIIIFFSFSDSIISYCRDANKLLNKPGNSLNLMPRYIRS